MPYTRRITSYTTPPSYAILILSNRSSSFSITPFTNIPLTHPHPAPFIKHLFFNTTLTLFTSSLPSTYYTHSSLLQHHLLLYHHTIALLHTNSLIILFKLTLHLTHYSHSLFLKRLVLLIQQLLLHHNYFNYLNKLTHIASVHTILHSSYQPSLCSLSLIRRTGEPSSLSSSSSHPNHPHHPLHHLQHAQPTLTHHLLHGTDSPFLDPFTHMPLPPLPLKPHLTTK